MRHHVNRTGSRQVVEVWLDCERVGTITLPPDHVASVRMVETPDGALMIDVTRVTPEDLGVPRGVRPCVSDEECCPDDTLDTRGELQSSPWETWGSAPTRPVYSES